jgi:hypothetical protein
MESLQPHLLHLFHKDKKKFSFCQIFFETFFLRTSGLSSRLFHKVKKKFSFCQIFFETFFVAGVGLEPTTPWLSVLLVVKHLKTDEPRELPTALPHNLIYLKNFLLLFYKGKKLILNRQIYFWEIFCVL